MHTDSRPLPPAAGYADREPTLPPNWHGLVVWDVFLNGLATGLYLVAASADLAAPGVFGPVAAVAYPVALVLLLTDLACLVLDLGDPLRFHHMLRVFKPTSPMSLGTWFLSAYSFALTAIAALDLGGLLGLLPGDSAAVRGVWTAALVVGLPLALGSAVYKGVLFSTSSQPGWRDARWLGAYHASSAVALGCAGLLALAVGTGNERAAAVLRPALALLVVMNAVPLALLIRELRPTLERRETRSRLGGFAALVVGGGVLAALVLLAVPGGAVAELAAVVLVLAAGFGFRSLIVLLPHRPDRRVPSPYDHVRASVARS